jgi:hypothetical protein
MIDDIYLENFEEDITLDLQVAMHRKISEILRQRLRKNNSSHISIYCD